MILENTTFWVVGFYVFSALSLLFFWGMMRLINHSKFRSEEGDSTYEVGYEEDSVGRDRSQEEGSTTSGKGVSNASISEFYNG